MAPNSTYCPHDRWTLWIEAPHGEPRVGAAVAAVETPRGFGSLLERLRLEKQCAHLQRELDEPLDKLIARLDEQLEKEPADFDTHRRLGLLTLLRRHYERSNAHFQRAHELNPHDFETHINYALVLTERGKLQPALELLQAAQKQWPDTPLVLLNLALVALQARRANVVLDTVETLETLWKSNPALAGEYFVDAMTARGLALLQLNRLSEAHNALLCATRGQYTQEPMSAPSSTQAPAQAPPPRLNGSTSGHADADDDDEPGEDDLFDATTAAERRQLLQSVQNYGQEHSSAVQATVQPPQQAQSQAATDHGKADHRKVDRRMAPPGTPWPYDERRLFQRRRFAHDEAPPKVSTGAKTPTLKQALPDITLLEGETASADALNNLAIVEAAAGDYDRAVSRLGAALRLEPGNTRVHNNLGVIAYEQGHLPAAYKYLNFARQIENHVEQIEPETRNHLAVVLSAMGKIDESWEEFQRAGNHERAEFEVWYNLGRAYIEVGKPDRGVAYLRRAFQANPQHPDVHVVLGAAYLLRGNASMRAEALKYLKRALQLQPRHLIAFCDLAMLLCEMDNPDGARLLINQALKAYPRSAELIFLRALVTMSEEEETHMARAGALFNTSLAGRPDMLVSLYDMALCQFVMGLRDAAAQQMEAVTKRDAAFSPAYFMIGIGHAIARRYPEALDAWQRAAQFEPNNPDLQANMGFVYYQRGDWQNAIACYVKAHRAAPEDADILSCLGLSFGRAAATIREAWEEAEMKYRINPKPRNPQDEKNYNELLNRAITALEQSLQIKPHSPITHSNLGLVYYFKRHIERAVEQWRIVSRMDASYASRREEEQYHKFDDTQVTLRPLDWRARIVGIAPLLPRPHTRLLPGRSARAFRPAISDPALQKMPAMRRELEHVSQTLGWIHAHK
jgi:tetratricopeptide (TPR) repeat protein